MKDLISKNEVVVTVRIPSFLKHQLDRMSDDRDWSLSHCVRDILVHYFYPDADYIARLNFYASITGLLKNKKSFRVGKYFVVPKCEFLPEVKIDD